ncbi:unnamed protein product [Lathyrus sativus]|nr:unnamed protein product [Lathyrus sativus]
MAFSCSNLPIQKLFSSKFVLLIFTTFYLSLAATKANSQKTVSFNVTDGKNRWPKSDFIFQGDALIFPDGVLSLTDVAYTSIGRVLYSTPVPIWDRTTGNVANFVTSFTFEIYTWPGIQPGDGLIFFLTDPANKKIPANSGQGLLGVADAKNSLNNFIGVEFDNYVDTWDPKFTHIGIDLNSIYSTKCTEWKLVPAYLVKVEIAYDSPTSTMTVVVTDEFGNTSKLSQIFDLKCVLSDTVLVGISGSSRIAQAHDIHSWSFSSTLDTTARSSSDRTNNNKESYA